jgi:hypothetical protein
MLQALSVQIPGVIRLQLHLKNQLTPLNPHDAQCPSCRHPGA